MKNEKPQEPIEVTLATEEVILRGKGMTLEEAEAQMLRNGALCRSSDPHPNDEVDQDGQSLDEDHDN